MEGRYSTLLLSKYAHRVWVSVPLLAAHLLRLMISRLRSFQGCRVQAIRLGGVFYWRGGSQEPGI